MQASKALLLVVIGVLVLTAGVFAFVPASRPMPVKKLFWKMGGLTPATSPEDCMDRFKRAMEKRDYEAAATLYCGPAYGEWLAKGGPDAKELARTLDDLRSAMSKYGVKSDKGEFQLYVLDPFPPDFKVVSVTKSGDNATAVLSWAEPLARYPGMSILRDENRWAPDNRIYTSLLPIVINELTWTVPLAKDKDGFWRVEFPVQVNERHLRDTVEYLRKNGTNYRNALNNLKNDVKNDAPTKENFENSLRKYLQESK